jgi:hypothetical protein
MSKATRSLWVLGVMCLICARYSLAASVERTEIATLPAGYANGSLVLSSDGKHYAFVVGSSGSQRIVRDGVESQEFKACSLPIFSPTDKLFFWGVKDGKVVLSADGRIITTSLAGEGAIVFSKDGAHWAAFGAEVEKRDGNAITPGSIVMFADGVEVGKYDDIRFSMIIREGLDCRAK